MKNNNFQKNKIGNFYKNKKILITGHTGFKGSWLSLWLHMYGAKILGISNSIPTKPSHYKLIQLKNLIKEKKLDIRDYKKLNKEIKNFEPDIIFHLAAQAIVSKSFNNPIETWSTNLNGTLNILESLRFFKKKCTVIFITSDKCYENREINIGYKETDRLGGSDIYSASKASVEIAINSYFQSFIKDNKKILIGIGRAGNVIGGGDWAENRLIPDCVRSTSLLKKLNIRNPNSTRPWQHVLEPLSGYINLGYALSKNLKLNNEAFNFGPPSKNNFSVINVIKEMKKTWEKINFKVLNKNFIKESSLLSLNCTKAVKKLKWTPTLTFAETIKETVIWYKKFYNNDYNNLLDLSKKQIVDYVNLAKKRNKDWSK
tara:strand:+ start:818 stop:1933 length:1116 start_codon:yes stop_codon:yes gene_type:complete